MKIALAITYYVLCFITGVLLNVAYHTYTDYQQAVQERNYHDQSK